MYKNYILNSLKYSSENQFFYENQFMYFKIQCCFSNFAHKHCAIYMIQDVNRGYSVYV